MRYNCKFVEMLNDSMAFAKTHPLGRFAVCSKRKPINYFVFAGSNADKSTINAVAVVELIHILSYY